MSVFEGIEQVNAESQGQKAYFEEGKYQVRIESVFLHTKRLGGGKLFIVESTVLASSNENIRPDEQKNWVHNLELDYALPRIKAFIGSAYGYCPRRSSAELNKHITRTICDETVGHDNPLKGKVVSLECRRKTTSSGRDFLLYVWSPGEQTD